MISDRKGRKAAGGPSPTSAERLLWPTLLYIYLSVLLWFGGIDHAVAHLFAAPDKQGFPLRHAYLTEYLLHDVAQTAMKVVVGLLPPLLLGGVFAVDQWARGAHFPSHDLTTA